MKTNAPPAAPAPADDNEDKDKDSPNGAGSAASTFRNVSACNRCRLRKNRCDQRLPACGACEKARVRCVGFDPITKREIPRRYVGLDFLFFLLVCVLEGLISLSHRYEEELWAWA